MTEPDAAFNRISTLFVAEMSFSRSSIPIEPFLANGIPLSINAGSGREQRTSCPGGQSRRSGGVEPVIPALSTATLLLCFRTGPRRTNEPGHRAGDVHQRGPAYRTTPGRWEVW